RAASSKSSQRFRECLWIIRRTSLARTERIRDQCARLGREPGLDADGRCRCRRTAGPAERTPGCALQMRSEMPEIAHVLRLLLAPDELGLRMSLQGSRHGIGRKRPELLDADERDPFVQIPFGAGLQQLVVDLARAQHHATGALDLAV